MLRVQHELMDAVQARLCWMRAIAVARRQREQGERRSEDLVAARSCFKSRATCSHHRTCDPGAFRHAES